MSLYKDTRRHHGVFRKKRHVTKRFKNTLRKSRRGHVMRGGMRIKYKGGIIYDGEVKGGMANGIGTMKWPDGSVYEGEFKNGLPHGRGKYTWKNGNVYEGEFKNDKKDGKGIQTFAHGEKYEGDFVDDNRHGKGKYTFKNGDVYEGDYKDGKRTGRGIYKWIDGRMYTGEWLDNKLHGIGTMKWPEGDVFECEFKNDMAHGKGKRTTASGEVYEGDFANGFQHGKGKYTYKNGDVYKGDYRDGKKTGRGVYKWNDGKMYTGEWLDNKRHGRGKMHYVDGTIQIGNWENDHIQPSLLLQDGNVSNLAFHPTESLLLAVCRGKTHKEPQTLFLQRFNRNTGHIIDNVPIAQSMLDTPGRSIAFHPRAPIFAVGNIKGEVDLFRWEIHEDSVVGLSANKMSTTKIDPGNRGFRRQCEIIAFHPSEPLFATCGKTDDNEYTTRIWRIDESDQFRLTDLRLRHMTSYEEQNIAFHPSQPILITASTMLNCVPRDIAAENHVKLWNYFNINNPQLIAILSSRPPSEEMFLYQFEHQIDSFNSDHRFFHTDFVNFVAFHPTEPFFATASKDATIKMWRMTPNPDDSLYVTCVATFNSDVNVSPVICVAFHPTAPLLVGGFYNGNAVVWSYTGIVTKKVLTLVPVMYEQQLLSVFPLPDPPPHGLRMTTAMLTEAKDKLRNVVMTPRVPFSMSGVQEDSDSSPSPPPSKTLTRAELNKLERKRRQGQGQGREEQREGIAHVFVSCVNFQVDSRGVSFLEIGRNNTNIVEVVNVTHLATNSKVIESRKNDNFSTRKAVVQALSDKFASATHPNRRQFTHKEVFDAIQRGQVPTKSVVRPNHDEGWIDTQNIRSGQGLPLQVELDSEAIQAIKEREESQSWRQRFEEAKQLQQLKLERERQRELLSQPLQSLQPPSLQPLQPLQSQPPQPQPPQPLQSPQPPSPRSPLQPPQPPSPRLPEGGNRRHTRRKNRRNK